MSSRHLVIHTRTCDAGSDIYALMKFKFDISVLSIPRKNKYVC